MFQLRKQMIGKLVKLENWCLITVKVTFINADENDMFYQLLPNLTLAAKNDPCKGGKKSKK